MTTLGRTGLKVSRLGLGAGGHSQLGISQGKSIDHAAGIVRLALDQGINFIDTAEVYKTELAIGLGIQGRRREQVVLSTKLSPRTDNRLKNSAEIEHSLAASLERLRVSYVDIYLVHGVSADDYQAVEQDIYPVLDKLRARGMVRFIGLTEAFGPDRQHAMLAKAVRADCWDVIMAGYNYLNHSARQEILPAAKDKNIGVLDMFAVRHALTDQQRLRPIVTRLVEQGVVDKQAIDCDRPLHFLLDESGAADLSEAGYRFCLAEPCVDVVLCGTGNPEHLKQNIAAADKGPLDRKSVQRLLAIFKNVRNENGDGA
jgi:aryl-alcohol dehydrogenase-like predicted oxidoreductase